MTTLIRASKTYYTYIYIHQSFGYACNDSLRRDCKHWGQEPRENLSSKPSAKSLMARGRLGALDIIISIQGSSWPEVSGLHLLMMMVGLSSAFIVHF